MPHRRARSSPARRAPHAAHPETPAHPPCLVRARLAKCIRVNGNAQLEVCAGRVPASCNVAPSRYTARVASPDVAFARRDRSRSLLRKAEHTTGPALLRSPLVPTRSAQIPLARWNSALTPSFASSRCCCLIAAASASFASSPVLPSTAPERGTCKNESVTIYYLPEFTRAAHLDLQSLMI
ncbi:hypothetical protein C8R43DRAFT_1010908 [Mycena crocata]|nr:hypothetical protein C8R43DRAFT_1010908 [Mycena crocata]